MSVPSQMIKNLNIKKKLIMVPSVFLLYPLRKPMMYIFSTSFAMFKHEYIKLINPSMFSLKVRSQQEMGLYSLVCKLLSRMLHKAPWPFCRPSQ